MKNSFKFTGLAFAALLGSVAVSCSDSDNPNADFGPEPGATPEASISIVDASKSLKPVTVDDSSIDLQLNVSLEKPVSNDVSFTVMASDALVDEINASSPGSNYVMMPAANCVYPVKLTIAKGQTSRELPLTVALPSDANKVNYILPLMLVDVAGPADIKAGQDVFVYAFIKGNVVTIDQATQEAEPYATYVVAESIDLPLDITMTDPVSKDVKVTVQADASLIDAYNAATSSECVALPTANYTMNNTVVIPAGQTKGSSVITVNSLPADNEKTYALGVKLVSTDDAGVRVHRESVSFVYVLRPAAGVIQQKGAVFTGYTGVSGMPTVNINKDLAQWTFEVWVKHDDNSKLSTASYDWLDASNESAEWRKRVYPPQSAPFKLPSPIDFKFWPQGNQPLSPMMQFTANQVISASIHNDGFAFMPDEWTHLAFVYDSSTGTLIYYVNGVQYGFGGDCTAGAQTFQGMTASYPGATAWGTMTLATPGVSSQTFYQYYKIEMAQMRLWNRCLPVEEIQKQYILNVDPDVANGLEAYWKMDEGEGTTLKDCSGSGLDITWSKLQWSDTVYDLSAKK